MQGLALGEELKQGILETATGGMTGGVLSGDG